MGYKVINKATNKAKMGNQIALFAFVVSLSFVLYCIFILLELDSISISKSGQINVICPI